MPLPRPPPRARVPPRSPSTPTTTPVPHPLAAAVGAAVMRPCPTLPATRPLWMSKSRDLPGPTVHSPRESHPPPHPIKRAIQEKNNLHFYWSIHWLIKNWLIDWSTDWLIDWLVRAIWSVDWLDYFGRQIDRLIIRLIDWLLPASGKQISCFLFFVVVASVSFLLLLDEEPKQVAFTLESGGRKRYIFISSVNFKNIKKFGLCVIHTYMLCLKQGFRFNPIVFSFWFYHNLYIHRKNSSLFGRFYFIFYLVRVLRTRWCSGEDIFFLCFLFTSIFPPLFLQCFFFLFFRHCGHIHSVGGKSPCLPAWLVVVSMFFFGRAKRCLNVYKIWYVEIAAQLWAKAIVGLYLKNSPSYHIHI